METTPVSSSPRTLKVRGSKSVDASTRKTTKTITVKAKPKSIKKETILPESDLSHMIATAAYFIAQQRNFAPGNELADWLLAEQQIFANHKA